MYNLITQHVKEHINFIFCPVYKIMDIKKTQTAISDSGFKYLVKFNA